MRNLNHGQSVIEYVLISALVIILSVLMIPKILGTFGNPGIFSTYVSTATGAMK